MAENPKTSGEDEATSPRSQIILNCVSDLVGKFLYYDRKGDEELPVGAIEKAVADGEISVDAIVEAFRAELQEGLSV
jgi:hypothetical protein